MFYFVITVSLTCSSKAKSVHNWYTLALLSSYYNPLKMFYKQFLSWRHSFFKLLIWVNRLFFGFLVCFKQIRCSGPQRYTMRSFNVEYIWYLQENFEAAQRTCHALRSCTMSNISYTHRFVDQKIIWRKGLNVYYSRIYILRKWYPPWYVKNIRTSFDTYDVRSTKTYIFDLRAHWHGAILWNYFTQFWHKTRHASSS